MYDTGLGEEIGDAVSRAFTSAEQRAEGFFGRMKDNIVEQTDTMIEDTLRKPVTPLWDEMKRDARLPFEIGADGTAGDGIEAMKTIALALKESGLKIHLAGHSTGGVLIGHLLGAAGGVESVFSIMAIRNGIIPPTINYETPDPECDLDYGVDGVTEQPVRAALSNSFGFGGHNVSLLVRGWNGA